MSLRFRMAAVAGSAVALAVIVVAVASYEGTKSSLLGQVDHALAEQVAPVAQAASEPRPDELPPPGLPPGRPGGAGGFSIERDGPPPRFGVPAGSMQFITPQGEVRRPPATTTGPPVDARARAVAASGQGRYYSDAHVGSIHVRVLTVGLGPQGAVQAARSREDVDNVLNDELLLLILVGAGGIVLAAVLSIVVARTALAPITRFTRRTEALSAHPDTSQRLDASGRDEIARLAHSFNATLDALEASVAAQRNLVADASHELRTPIATVRANIQLLREADRLSPAEQQSLRDDIIAELDELTALVSDVVELARGSKPTPAEDDVRLDEIAREVVERARRRAPDLDFSAELESTLVEGEPERVARAVSNLVDNARRWSPPGGTIEVELAGGVLSVRDHGPGFHEEDLPHVFDRFYRSERARSEPGSGLGLAIVRQAAEAHGGWARAANAPGGGAVLRVSFGPSTFELTPSEVSASLS
jgi:two-component system, OmpR family, sensor histidine kinase MprB